MSDLGLRVLELVRIATQELGLPIARAVEIASSACTQDGARFVTRSGAEVRFAMQLIEQRLRERLVDAIEATPRLRRGRPRMAG